MDKIQEIKEFFKNNRYSVSISASVFVVLIILLDYYDLNIVVGFGIFSKYFKPNPVEGIVVVLLVLTFWETLKTRMETIRQTEVSLRPYLRISWETSQIGDNRRGEGLTDSCIVVSNNGNGLMRKVKYSVSVDSKKVAVKNHSLIIPGDNTNMVYDDADNKAGVVLGCRNDMDFTDKNKKIIQNSKITISGSYRDVEGREYRFSFISDTKEQSWFAEKYIQSLKK